MESMNQEEPLTRASHLSLANSGCRFPVDIKPRGRRPGELARRVGCELRTVTMMFWSDGYGAQTERAPGHDSGQFQH